MILPPGWKHYPLTAPVSTTYREPPASQLRPGWLADNQTWRETLAAMPAEDARWFEEQWQLAGGRPPAVDLSWITYTHQSPSGGWVLALAEIAVLVSLGAALIAWWLR